MYRKILAFAVLLAAVGASAIAQPPRAAAVDIIERQETPTDPEPVDAGFQAGPCTADVVPLPDPPPQPPPPPQHCSAKTPQLFFKQAGGHPPVGFTQVIAKRSATQVPGPGGEVFRKPVGMAKTLLVDLPAGFSVNPQGTPQCPRLLTTGEAPVPACPPSTQVGEVSILAYMPDLSNQVQSFPNLPIYNLVPREGEPARFGTTLPGLFSGFVDPIILNAGLAWEGDFHEYFTIHVPTESQVGEIWIVQSRLVFDGQKGLDTPGGALLTLPMTCNDPAVEPFKRQYTTVLHADSVQEEVPGNRYDTFFPAPPSLSFLAGSEEVRSPLPRGEKPEGCAQIPFEPRTSIANGAATTGSPTGPVIEVEMPFDPEAPIYQSHLKDARITLPRGLTINPAAAEGLLACTDEQFGKGTRAPISCPEASAVGTVAIDTPPLPDGTLTGKVFVGTPLDSDPASGDMFRLFLHAGSAARGISVRLVAQVEADPQTGRLTAVLRDLPQLPFESVRIDLNDGARATLTNPDTCGPHLSTRTMGSWSLTPDNGPADSGFALAGAATGGPCPASLAARAFQPSFALAPASTAAGRFTPLTVKLGRGDGQQELKGLELTLPPNITAKLAGVPYCSEAAIAAAQAQAGAAERAQPSCSEASRLGSAVISAGSGPAPLRIEGRVFLAGPYKGAPLSLVVITPAVAGPFDLGTVAVRVALFLNPETAQISTVSDPIPHVFGGIELDVAAIDLVLDRPGFILNGTGCGASSANASVAGGGGDPADPAARTSQQASSPHQLSGCGSLGFKPKLGIVLKGGTKRSKHPRLEATLTPVAGEANTAFASVALPKALILDQSKLSQVCTRVQFAANACPPGSVYGTARATSPLLAEPLEGPVLLRSSNNRLPDLVAHLQGQLGIDLVAKIDTFKGGIRTTFSRVPDVPVTQFKMVIPGGKKGLLQNSRSLCAAPVKAIVQLRGHNGASADKRSRLKVACKKKGKKGKKGKAGKARQR